MNSMQNFVGRDELVMRYLSTKSFDQLHDSAMTLLADATEYLKDAGKRLVASRSNQKDTIIDMANVLTTAVMNVSSAVFLLRAVRDGTVSLTRGLSEINGTTLLESQRGDFEAMMTMPAEFLDLVVRCEEVRGRLYRLFTSFSSTPAPVSSQVHLRFKAVHAAFEGVRYS